MGRLERKLNVDLINKIVSGWQPEPGGWKSLGSRSFSHAQRHRREREYRGQRRNITIHRSYLKRKELLRHLGKVRHNESRPRRPPGYQTTRLTA